MVVLGLLLVLAAGVFGADVVLENTRKASGSIFQQTVSNLSLGGVFLAGAITALVLAVGLWLLFGGARRKARRRSERKHALRQTQAEREALAAEKERLARQLEEERRTHPGAGDARTVRYDDAEGSVATDGREGRLR